MKKLTFIKLNLLRKIEVHKILIFSHVKYGENLCDDDFGS